jgi:hypothetical protein
MPTWLIIFLLVFVVYPITSILYCAMRNRNTRKVLITVSNAQDPFVP